jgi:hypothetical protein
MSLFSFHLFQFFLFAKGGCFYALVYFIIHHTFSLVDIPIMNCSFFNLVFPNKMYGISWGFSESTPSALKKPFGDNILQTKGLGQYKWETCEIEQYKEKT